MIFDFVVLSLVLWALVAGFEKGLFRSFSLLIAGSLSMLIALSLTPAMIEFVEESVGEFSLGWQFAATIGLFLFATLLIYHLIQSVSMHGSSNYMRQVLGSLLMVCMMVFSIAVITGFLQESGVMSKHRVHSSYSAKVIFPIQEATAKVWEKAIAGADAIRSRSLEQQQAALSLIH